MIVKLHNPSDSIFSSLPHDEALMKLFYLALRNISQKWTLPIRDWKAALTRFTIQFEDRMNNV